MVTHNAVATIQDLLETSRDGQEGYRSAAEHIKDPEIKRFCLDQSTQRGEFAAELETQLRRLKQTSDIDRSGSVAGSLHRAWIDLKSTAGVSDGEILSSAEQGEDSAKRAYEKALASELPTELKGLIQTQYRSIVAAHDRVRSWRDRLKAA